MITMFRLWRKTPLMMRSTLGTVTTPLSLVNKRSHGRTTSDNEICNFSALFPAVVCDLTEIANNYNCKESAKWFARALDYNVPRSKKSRGLLTVLTYKNLIRRNDSAPENVKLAQYLGWCVEMMQSALLVADDIMDNSTRRRGQLCWHKLEDVGLIAINDAFMIENATYFLLQKHFSHLDCYIDLLNLFHEVAFVTALGQSMDMLGCNQSPGTFTMDQYKSIAVNKTAYFCFYLPIVSAMHLAGYDDVEALRQTKGILLEMGILYQVQDDFLDCFGDPEKMGKLGSDIRNNKCSWLAVDCMQRANENQKALMLECYGKSDPVKVARIKELYKSLGLPTIYANYEKERYNMIKARIQQSSKVPREIFLQLLNKIYQRDS